MVLGLKLHRCRQSAQVGVEALDGVRRPRGELM